MTDDCPDEVDLMLLEALQDGVPLVDRPFAVLAEQVKMTEDRVLERLERLQEMGILRGISPVIESGPMGIRAATLVAVHVPEERVLDVAGIVNRYPEVSHNFLRQHHFNLWFTVAAPDDARIREILKEIREQGGINEEDSLDLPTVRRLKIDVRFRLRPPRDMR